MRRADAFALGLRSVMPMLFGVANTLLTIGCGFAALLVLQRL
ncbi:MAG: hypothetical protein NTV11_15820 [Rhodocyclales bacterium]|nr:hypothetical protein [Rhodocyclales bacterium]